MSEIKKDFYGMIFIGILTIISCVVVGYMFYENLPLFGFIWIIFVIILGWCTGEWINFYLEDRHKERQHDRGRDNLPVR